MAEKGKVIALKDQGSVAVVSFMRTEACAKCKKCMAGFQESEMILEVPNEKGAKQGNTVYIEIPDNGFFTASLIMYVIPLVLMLLGFFGGIYLSPVLGASQDLLAFGLGIAMLALSFFIIRANEKRFKTLKMFTPVIVRVEA